MFTYAQGDLQRCADLQRCCCQAARVILKHGLVQTAPSRMAAKGSRQLNGVAYLICVKCYLSPKSELLHSIICQAHANTLGFYIQD